MLIIERQARRIQNWNRHLISIKDKQFKQVLLTNYPRCQVQRDTWTKLIQLIITVSAMSYKEIGFGQRGALVGRTIDISIQFQPDVFS